MLKPHPIQWDHYKWENCHVQLDSTDFPKAPLWRKNEKHSKLQWGSGDKQPHEVKAPNLILSLLYYTFWDLLVRVYVSIAGQVAFNDNPVQLTFNIFVSLFFCLKDRDPGNLYAPLRHQGQEQSADGFPSPAVHPAFKMFAVPSWIPSGVTYWIISSQQDCLILLSALLVGLSRTKTIL